jgi:DNA-binding PucR family transcriptional regulator
LSGIANIAGVRGGITVREALRLRSLQRARIVAGTDGLERVIGSVNVMEVPDILPFVKEHELLLTTAYPIRDDPTALERLVPELAKRDLAAIAIVRRAFLREIPAAALARADELGLPVLELPEQASFNEIMAEVFGRLLDRQAMQLRMRRYEAALLDEFVSDPSASPDVIAEHAALLGWDLGIPRIAMIVELRRDGSAIVGVAGQPLEDGLLHALGGILGSGAIVWAGRSGLSLLVDARSDPMTVARQVRDGLRRVAPDLRAAIGIGRASDGVEAIHRSFREASRALAVGRDLDGDEAVLGYEQLGVYRVLHRFGTDDAELRRYCDDLIGPLVEHDRARGTDLVRTLDRYLRNERSITATARDLQVHYNTLRYRLRRIDDLVGGIDRRPGTRLGLELALHAWKLLNGPRAERAIRERDPRRAPPWRRKPTTAGS